MGNIGFRIVSNIKRPPKELIDLFKDATVANIDDCMNRTAAVNYAIKPYNKCKLLGTAFTIKVPPGDNLMVHKALDMAKPGDVLVIAAGGETERAILGEPMVTYLKVKGVAGCSRWMHKDADAISKMDIPVYAKGATLMAHTKMDLVKSIQWLVLEASVNIQGI